MSIPHFLPTSPDLDSEEDEDRTTWDDWTEAAAEEVGDGPIVCLFCEQPWASAALLFQHCKFKHAFDFSKLRKEYCLGFYDSLRLLNFIRSQVAINKCWNCGHVHESQRALQRHLLSNNHVESSFLVTKAMPESENGPRIKDVDFKVDTKFQPDIVKIAWQDDKYLTPFLKDDPLLYTFEEIADDDSDDSNTVDKVMAMSLIDADVKSKVVSREASNGSGSASYAVDDSMAGIIEHQLSKGLKAQNHNDSCEPQLKTFNGSTISFSNSEFGNSLDSSSCSLRLEEAEAKDMESLGRLDCGNGFDHEHNFGSISTFDSLDEPSNCGLSSQENQITDESLNNVPNKTKKKKSKVSFADIAKKERGNINQSYFGAYSSFGIHREMLSDKVRTEAYQKAILGNPSLFKDAVVMDVGCGTCILSLFAAKAGAKKVIAVEASQKMASVAQQVAKSNGYWEEVSKNGGMEESKGVINVIQGMIEELDAIIPIEAGGVDVLVSEWMGYCLLFESMLGSVLDARDRWLKPGGAILPDTAEMFVAGFGRGGTSLPFWENVYGFDMKCIGQEVVENAAETPIVDVLESNDVITEACLIHDFDIVNMKADDVDFTTTFELRASTNGFDNSYEFIECAKSSIESLQSNGKRTATTSRFVWCHGLVLWFDVGFTSRYCKQNPVRLSTSPHSPPTHWSQTLLTFREPIALLLPQSESVDYIPEAPLIGTSKSPATILKGRISIARSFRHRSIDISLETAAVGAGGTIRTWPVQMFDI